MKKNVRIVFQGDSITDAGREKRNYHDMGAGYPHYAAEHLSAAFPQVTFEFINQGISGNRSGQLFDRLYPDAIAFDPDVISILIGVNDVWHRHSYKPVMTTDEQYEVNLRTILTTLRQMTSAKIVVLQPFLLDAEANAHLRPEIDRIIPIANKLAAEYADVYIPLDELFAEEMKSQPEPCYYSGDGVHPNDNGRAFIGKLYAEAVAPLIETL